MHNIPPLTSPCPSAEALFGQIAQLNAALGPPATLQRKASTVGRKQSALMFGGYSMSEKVGVVMVWWWCGGVIVWWCDSVVMW